MNQGINELEFRTILFDDSSEELESLAERARLLTINHFGYDKGLYIPLYISNKCANICTYCGFSNNNKLQRKTLSKEELEKNLTDIYQRGYRHILLVAGEWPKEAKSNYLSTAVSIAKKVGFPSVAVEFGALEEKINRDLVGNGADQFVLYQETYHQPTYKKVHVKGKKTDFDYRIDGIKRAIDAGFKKISLGFLGGLYDHRFESLSLFRHLKELIHQYPECHFSISFPRLTKATGMETFPYILTDKDYLRMLCAFRLAFPRVSINLSTRESIPMREALIKICATYISAESITSPGQGEDELAQFEIKDNRNLFELSEKIKSLGFNIHFKDWENYKHV
jgi:2-iminoacetate synthase